MIRINGYPLYQVGLAMSLVIDRLQRPVVTTADLLMVLRQAKTPLEFFVNLTYLPFNTKNTGQLVLDAMNDVLDHADTESTPQQRNAIYMGIFQFQTTLASDLFWFDLYWIRPKLGYATTALLSDASVVFPTSISGALSPRIKYEVQQAANCVLYELPSAVGFHVLRAIEILILDYFTIPGWSRGDANSWAAYAKVLRQKGVHRKIVAMIERLATLHRNELMHAEAVLSLEEAVMLFAIMQEVVPVMIADVAKRKGKPITDFPILNDPRWQ